MSEDAIVSEPASSAPVVREPRIGTPPAPDHFRLGATSTLRHRGVQYRTELVADDTWEVRGEDGRVLGSVVIVSPAGEEGEAVYGSRSGSSDTVEYEGTDWRSVTAGMINQVLDA
ncbi:MAG TPA: hypothetical protein VFQ96_08050 [Microbacteriaceae bacterium]|nr:hypothetical protein [Microbacteriaceae bacterium]